MQGEDGEEGMGWEGSRNISGIISMTIFFKCIFPFTLFDAIVLSSENSSDLFSLGDVNPSRPSTVDLVM